MISKKITKRIFIVFIIYYIIAQFVRVFYPNNCPDEDDEKEILNSYCNSIVIDKSSDCSRGNFIIYIKNGKSKREIKIKKTHMCLYQDIRNGDSLKKEIGEKSFYLKKNNLQGSNYVRYDYSCETKCYCNFYLFDVQYYYKSRKLRE